MTEAMTNRIAAFAVDPTHTALPAEVDHAVRRAMLDSVGVAVAGTRHAAHAKVLDLVANASGICSLVGSPHRTDPVNAALANGVAAHVLDFDDTILPTRAHLSAALLPPLAAAGEVAGWTLSEIIPAFAVGFEIQSRINHTVYPSIHLRGWQGTGIAGGAGAAAAVGRLFGLPAAGIAHAMGIAATGAAGLIATFGSMSKALNIGRAGASGLQSALLAREGFTSHADILGAGRFLEMFDDAPRADLLTNGLGERWSILDNGYKPYPCGFVAHAMIDAVRELRAGAPRPENLLRLRLRVSPESTQLMGRADPATELEAKFSLAYVAAVAWVEGNVTPAAFESTAIADPRYRAVMPLIEIASAEGVRQHEAEAEGHFPDGAPVAVRVAHALGTPARPMTDADLIEKFNGCLEMGGLPGAAELCEIILHGGGVRVDQLMARLRWTGRTT